MDLNMKINVELSTKGWCCWYCHYQKK